MEEAPKRKRRKKKGKDIDERISDDAHLRASSKQSPPQVGACNKTSTTKQISQQEDAESDRGENESENDEEFSEDSDEESDDDESDDGIDYFDQLEGIQRCSVKCILHINILYFVDDEDTDEEAEGEWIRKKKNFHVKLYGNSCLYVTRSFTFMKPDNPWGFQNGLITDVVCKKNDKDKLYFKFYDTDKYRKPPLKEDQYGYGPCTEFMSSSAKKAIIDWHGCKEFNGRGLINRKVRKQFLAGEWFTGRVVNYVNKLYGIIYDDGDSEDVSEKELMKILRPESY